MNTNIIIKSLLNGIATCILLALMIGVADKEPVMQVLMAPSTIITGVCAMIGSFIGYRIRATRKN